MSSTAPAVHGMTGLRRTTLLVALTAGLSGLEAAVLLAVSFVSAVPLAAQAGAPAPFGLFHDLRWAMTFSWSPWSVAWMLAALVCLRSLIDALAVRLAWPADVAPPSLTTLLRRSALLTAVALVALTPWVTLTFLVGATGFSPVMFAAILGAAVTVLVLTPAMVTGSWWRPRVSLRGVGWTALVWVWLMVVALALTWSPGWVAVVTALGAGAVNAWLWRRVVAAALAPRRSRAVPAWPLVPVALTTAVLVIGGWTAVPTFTGASDASDASDASGDEGIGIDVGETPAATAQPVLYIAGFGSSYGGEQFEIYPERFDTVRYSYRGLGPDGEPLPYEPVQTFQSLDASADILAEQVRELAEASEGPVSLVAESEGTMVARTYLARSQDPPVDTLVQTSPLIRPARVYYPDSGTEAWGYGGGWAVRGLLTLFRVQNPALEVEADIPFLRSLVEDAPLYRDQTLCPVPGVRNYLLLPLEAALTAYRGPLFRIEWAALPAFHASLSDDAGVQETIAQVLDGEEPDRAGWAASFWLIRGAAGAWQAPALPFAVREAWGAAPRSDPEFGYRNCAWSPT
ncbi:hypothetical protein ACI8AC_08830 [Geodermatophilus sp. SYSU D00758]